MEQFYFLLVILAIYILYYVILVRKYRTYEKISTRVVVIAVSSMASGYLLSELRQAWSIHLLILLVLFVFGIFFYTWKLYRQLQEK